VAKAKVLIWDIETAPNIGYTWGKYDQNVIEFIQPWYTMCFSYQWVGQKKVHVVAQPDFPEYYAENPNCDLKVAEACWEVMDEADVAVAHNGNKFDIKKMNTRYAVHKLGPHSDVRPVDTLQVARRAFAFNSNKLDDLGAEFDIGRKIKHEGFSLWTKCMAGDMAAWARMKKYAKQDAALLHDLYHELLPWMPTHPNLSTIGGESGACPKCQAPSPGWIARGNRVARTYSYKQWQCKMCGSYSSERLRDQTRPPPSMV